MCLHVPALLTSKSDYCSQMHEEKHWTYNWQAIRPQQPCAKQALKSALRPWPKCLFLF